MRDVAPIHPRSGISSHPSCTSALESRPPLPCRSRPLLLRLVRLLLSLYALATTLGPSGARSPRGCCWLAGCLSLLGCLPLPRSRGAAGHAFHSRGPLPFSGLECCGEGSWREEPVLERICRRRSRGRSGLLLLLLLWCCRERQRAAPPEIAKGAKHHKNSRPRNVNPAFDRGETSSQGRRRSLKRCLCYLAGDLLVVDTNGGKLWVSFCKEIQHVS